MRVFISPATALHPECEQQKWAASRHRDRLKLLYWDADGFALWYKRLEEGTFRLPATASAGASVELRASELAMLLEGIDLSSIKRRRRFLHPSQKQPKD